MARTKAHITIFASSVLQLYVALYIPVITNKYSDGSSIVLYVATHKFIGTIKYLKKVGVALCRHSSIPT